MNSKIRLMGVINVSPESFFKGSIPQKASHLRKMAQQMEWDGADIIDVGAMSTAPYLNTQISEQEETKRLVSAIKIIKKIVRCPLSVDSFRAGPAEAALKAGATILNDVKGLRGDRRMPHVALKAKTVILMANPYNKKEGQFNDPVKETRKLLKESLKLAAKAGLSRQKMILDPGIGFFRKTRQPWWTWDLTILRELKKLTTLGCPLLVGLSRKSFLGHLVGGAPPEDRLPASLAATVIAIQNGATLIRTHDVKETKEAVLTIARMME